MGAAWHKLHIATSHCCRAENGTCHSRWISSECRASQIGPAHSDRAQSRLPMTNFKSPAPASHPLAVAKHWLAAYRWGKLDVLLSLYDEQATTECHYERISLPFRVNDVALTADGVRLNYQDYEGKSLRMDLRFGPSGKIVHTTWRENPSDNSYSHGHQAMSWSRQFDDPIPLRRGDALVTLRDAAEYIAALPKREHDAAEWQDAMEALLLVVRSGPTMLARIAVLRALNRDRPSPAPAPRGKRAG